MRILGPVTAAQGLDSSDDLSSFLEAGLDQGVIYQMGYQGICGDHDVTAGHQYLHQTARKPGEKAPESILVVRAKNRKPRERTALASICGR